MSLSVNFRSLPAILAEVERVVRPVMRHEPGVQPAFQPLLPCEERSAAPDPTLGPPGAGGVLGLVDAGRG